MASDRQVLANRINARRSTGPKSLQGKLRSRRNALKHGLTARNVVNVFEDDGEFNDFVKSIGASYRPTSPIHQELIRRLATLLWRLRRIQAAETGLIHIQAEHQQELQRAPCTVPSQQSVIPLPKVREYSSGYSTERERTEAKAQAFLRLCNINGDAIDRIGRYETSIWRQTMQLFLLLDHISVVKLYSRLPD